MITLMNDTKIKSLRQLLPEIVILCSIMYELYDLSKVQNELLFVSRSKHLLCGDWKNNKKKSFHIYQNNISCFLTKKTQCNIDIIKILIIIML